MDLKKLWPSLGPAIITVAGFFEPQVWTFLVAHPSLFMVMSTLTTLLANMVHSPLAPRLPEGDK